MTDRRHVVFAGAYGIQNSGDDAPLLVMTDGLRRLHPNVDFRFTVLARHSDSFLEAATGARFIANLEYQSREEATGKWFRGFNFADDRGDLEQVDATIRDADLVVAGAGNFTSGLPFGGATGSALRELCLHGRPSPHAIHAVRNHRRSPPVRTRAKTLGLDREEKRSGDLS